MKSTIQKSYDVVIIGAGPCGVSAANMLGQQGINTLIVDKEADIVTHPRAVGMCEEGSRIIDSIDILDDPELEFRLVNSIQFQNRKNESVFHADTYKKKNGHSIIRTFHQPDLELSLRKSLARWDCVDLAVSTELLEFNDLGHGIDITLKKGDDIKTIRSRYLLACDGASSSIRQTLDIGYEGATYPQDWMILDIENNPVDSSEIIFSINPERPSVTLPGPGKKRRWEFVVKKEDDPDQLFSDDNLAKLLSNWGDVKDMQVSRKAVYTFHARSANQYKKGNVFLMGDAAHITPPFAGQGMMAGLRDAYNLCWKISAVLKKELSPSILDSYQSERLPQCKQVIKFAQSMGTVILPQNKKVAKARDVIINLLGVLGVHSKTKGVPVDKIPNHINGGYFKHLLTQKVLKTGFEILADKLLDSHFNLLGWDVNPEKYLDTKTLARWHSMSGKKVTFTDDVSASKNNDASVLINKGQEYKKMLASGKRILVIRPDKMMVLNCSAKSLNRKLNKYMDQVGCTL